MKRPATKPPTAPYGQTLPLLQPIPKCECWNSTTGGTADLPAGLFITVEHAYDATQTTVLASTCGSSIRKDDPRIHLGGLPLSNGDKGYRFIIPNTFLALALGTPMPEKTEDIVGDLIAYETGQMSPKQEKKLFKTLKSSGLGKKLQGHYSSRC